MHARTAATTGTFLFNCTGGRPARTVPLPLCPRASRARTHARTHARTASSTRPTPATLARALDIISYHCLSMFSPDSAFKRLDRSPASSVLNILATLFFFVHSLSNPCMYKNVLRCLQNSKSLQDFTSHRHMKH